ncbi:hypothetical protein B0F90DRAFT_1673590 [Multifurca ochricompacta]|uniref:Uncharacterized protein n=1 Tax=Multifurca ochricompacta TaxID=376703 RepID=A0AAD4MC61_9AGAM|nr:hypothetical protein B0F90DRAFT_1673590 [Multifurca ochricompacta]
MWCTRWFIPLLILPLPSAPPYFLILFLISMIIHARPCFYCIILLTALFLSSCYWQPIPLTSAVSSSWATNATFATTLAAILSSPIAAPLPAVIRLADRCWCDVSSSRLFEPFDIARWERTSVEQLKEGVERDAARVEQFLSGDGEPGLLNELNNDPLVTNGTGSTTPQSNSLSRTSVVSIPQEPSPTETVVEQRPIPQIPAVSPSPSSNGPPVVPSMDLPWLRSKYDLRPYGFSMILDFSWSREE